jgi:hypothetical protein
LEGDWPAERGPCCWEVAFGENGEVDVDDGAE